MSTNVHLHVSGKHYVLRFDSSCDYQIGSDCRIITHRDVSRWVRPAATVYSDEEEEEEG
jgi:hypothetical protein